MQFLFHFLASAGLLVWMLSCLVWKRAGEKPGCLTHLSPEHRCKALAPGSSQSGVALTLKSARPIIKSCLHHFGVVT